MQDVCYTDTMGNFGRDSGRRDDRRGGFGGGRRSFGGGRDFGGNRGGFGRGPREMFKAVCANCGRECEVPFRPSGDKPVYCSDCYEKMGHKSERKNFDRSQNGGGVQNLKTDFDALNAKLDRIIGLLERNSETIKSTETNVTDETVQETAEEKPKKATKKKSSKTKASEA